MTGADLLESLEKLFGAKILEKSEFRGELTFTIARGRFARSREVLS